MVRINDRDYPYRPGMPLRELAESHFSDIPKVDFEDFIVVVNSKAIHSSQAEERLLESGDAVFMAPKLDGG